MSATAFVYLRAMPIQRLHVPTNDVTREQAVAPQARRSPAAESLTPFGQVRPDSWSLLQRTSNPENSHKPEATNLKPSDRLNI